MSAVAYLRVSSDEQSTHGVSLDNQRELLLKVRSDAHVLSDPAISSKTPLVNRPAGALLVKSVEEGTCKTVLCTRLDRLFRNAAEALVTVSFWQKIGVSLIVLDLNGSGMVDVCSPNGWLMFSIKAAFDEFERRTIGARTSSALQHLKNTHGKDGWISKKSGQHVAGLGRRERWVSYPEHHAAALAAIRGLQSAGLTLTEVADVLNQQLAAGEPGAVRPVRGERWSRDCVWRAIHAEGQK
jgi:DNA invertase Pin-like site-specific DNA recombinase